MPLLRQIRAKVNRGTGLAARMVGRPVTQYRPYDPLSPLDGSAVVSVFWAAFDADAALQMSHPATVGQYLFYLIADATNLCVGDYILDGQLVFFVGSMEDLRPPVVLRTNTTLSLVRPQIGVVPGLNPPGGDSLANETTILSGWPASVLTAGRGERGEVELAGDVRMGAWQVLLPAALGVEIRGSDILIDPSGLRRVVSSAELSPMGWRIEAQQEAA